MKAVRIDVKDERLWKGYEIDLETMGKKMEDGGTKLYALNIWGAGFELPNAGFARFPGHTLTVLQTVSDDGIPVFEVIQSYVDEYSLKTFLEEKGGSQSLSLGEMKDFFQAWSIVINSKDMWSEATVASWGKITHVNAENWKDGKPFDFGTSIQCIELPSQVDFRGEEGSKAIINIENALQLFKTRANSMQEPPEPLNDFSSLSGPL